MFRNHGRHVVVSPQGFVSGGNHPIAACQDPTLLAASEALVKPLQAGWCLGCCGNISLSPRTSGGASTYATIGGLNFRFRCSVASIEWPHAPPPLFIYVYTYIYICIYIYIYMCVCVCACAYASVIKCCAGFGISSDNMCVR